MGGGGGGGGSQRVFWKRVKVSILEYQNLSCDADVKAVLSPAKILVLMAVVVAKLVELLLPTTEICGSNPNIGKILSTSCTI